MTAILKLFDLVPGWVYAIALALVVAALGGERWLHNRTRAAHLQDRAEFATLRAQAEAAAAAQSEKFRAIEQELRNAQDTHGKEIEAVLVDLDRARAAGGVASGRLRDAAQAAAARARAACADSTASAVRETAGDAIGVLADVLGRADERAGILADLADRRGIAGRACERAYDEAHEALTRAATTKETP
jgi:hypothetical protein